MAIVLGEEEGSVYEVTVDGRQLECVAEFKYYEFVFI